MNEKGERPISKGIRPRTARWAPVRRGSARRSTAARRRPDGMWLDSGRYGGPGGQGRGGRPGPPPATRRRGRRAPAPALYFGAAVLIMVVAGALVLGAMVAREDARPPAPSVAMGRPAATGAGPAAYSDAASSQVFAGIADRSGDAAPLTEREVFPKSARVLPDPDARARLTLADSRLDADCAAAIWGARLGELLRAGGCTQVARGAYADRKAGYAATVAIINLATAADANRVVDSLGAGSDAGFVVSLPEAGRFDQGFSVARGRAMGHYAVIGWVRRLDGGGDAQNDALLSLLVTVESPRAILNRAAAAR